MDTSYIKEILKSETVKMMESIGDCFSDSRSKEQALKYICGLLSEIERKNGWQLAESRGDLTPYAVQQFLYRGRWDANEVRDNARSYVVEHLGNEDASLILDETGFIKKGDKSAGVARQYSGTAGKIENCQIGVFLSYASQNEHTLIDRELYLPKEWTDDRERCRAAGIADEVKFRTKTEMGLAMLKSAYEASVPFSWVTADSIYGDYSDIRMWLESIRKGYALAVSGKAYVWQGLRQHRVSDVLNKLPEEGWQRLSAGAGSKGERLHDWLCIELNEPPFEGWKRYLLVRRNISDPSDLRAFICFCPENTTLQKLVEIAGIRWTIEQSFEESKGEVGLDHYEVRNYQAWYKHITLASCAHILLTIAKFHIQSDDIFKAAVEPEYQIPKNDDILLITNGEKSDSLAAFKRGRNR